MDISEENNMLFKLLKINLIRKVIIKHIPSFTDINNLVNVCKFMNCGLEKENIERSILSYHDIQDIWVKNDHVHEYDKASSVIRLNNFKFTKSYYSESLRDRLRTFFGETLHIGSCVWSSIDLSINEWKEEDYVPFIQKLTEELNLNCATRKDVRKLKFELKFRDNADYIILDVLSHIKHDNIKRISLPVNCFTCPSNKYNVINCNIFNGFPNLTELSLDFSFSRSDYYDLAYHKDIFERFVQQFSTAKNPTILFESLEHEDAMRANELNEIINSITKYNVKVKLKVNIEYYKFIGECEKCADTMGFFSPVKQYITIVYDSISDYRRLLYSVEILKTFENLSTLDLKFVLPAITGNFTPSYNQSQRFWT
uniref:F-box domain-containing protein n=1 Tax=Strongyloides papillosus TaxID=174720 RepID=A0A0N5BYX9_STREA